MKIKIVLFFILFFASNVFAAEFIGEAMNPCGEPHKFTQDEIEIVAVLSSEGTEEKLLYKGRKYPKGFYFFYSDSDGEFYHKSWEELKAVVRAMAEEEGISVEEKCKGREVTK